MKRGLLVILIVILSTVSVAAQADSIYFLLKNRVDEHYSVVVGNAAKSSDSIAASEIVLALLQLELINIDVVVESQVHPGLNKIAVGHPCENTAVAMDCNNWPYQEGVGIIKLQGNSLIVSGTTPEDVRMAADVVAHYRDYPLLEVANFVIVQQTPGEQKLSVGKEPSLMECGDQLCELGEELTCFADCQEKNCDSLCRSKELVAHCRPLPTNPAVSLCKENEENFGLGYCATDYVCCCETEMEEPMEEPVIIKKRPIKPVGWEFDFPVSIVVTLSVIVVLLLGLLSFLMWKGSHKKIIS